MAIEGPSRVRALILVITTAIAPAPTHAEDTLPSPLRAQAVGKLARARRMEVVAANASARAAAQRPAIVSALDDPMIAVSLDHVPFDGMGLDRSLMFEQQFPLSRIRGHRRRGAEAGARRERANVARVALEVELEAVRAYWMVAEARTLAEIVDQQHALAKQLEDAALARYAANLGPQIDVLRAQTEVARFAAERRAIAAEVRAAEVMLNTSLARDADATIPPLDPQLPDDPPPEGDAVARAARKLPELSAGRAAIEEAEAEVRAMRSMYKPMALVRTGPAYTMEAGRGWMLMVGVSIPLWRGKLRAGVAEAGAMRDMATAELDAMRRMAEGEARGAREGVIAARVRFLALRDEIVPRAEQMIAPALAAYSAGQVPLVSVAEALQAVWTVRRDLVAARSRLGVAWARVTRATGEQTP
jgi:outer membrane protein, heavy metal efflux system